MGDTRRLEQLLLLVAYVRRHPGARVAEVAQVIGVRPAEVPALVDRLAVAGKPPFAPDDLIEVWIEHPDRVYVHLDQSLGQPLSLTRAEGTALAIALHALADSTAAPYAGLAGAALTKIKSTLSQPTAADVSDVEARILIDGADRGGAERFAVVSRALEERRAVDIDYYTAGRGELGGRRLRPYALVQRLSAWYVVGHDERSGEVRVFKLERLREARLTDERFEVPTSFDASRYQGALVVALEGAERARVRFLPPLAGAIVDDNPAAEPQPDGSVIVAVEFVEPEGLAAWVMSFGGHAEILAPPSLRAQVVARCEALLSSARAPQSDPP